MLVGAGVVGLVAFAAKGVRGSRPENRLDADERYDQPYDGGIPPYAATPDPAPVAGNDPHRHRPGRRADHPDRPHRRRPAMTQQPLPPFHAASDGWSAAATTAGSRGVCGGIADYAGVDANLVRLLVVLGTVLGFGSLLVAYLVAWVLMPQE